MQSKRETPQSDFILYEHQCPYCIGSGVISNSLVKSRVMQCFVCEGRGAITEAHHFRYMEHMDLLAIDVSGLEDKPKNVQRTLFDATDWK